MILLSIGHSKKNSELYDRFKELCNFLKEKSINIAMVESDVGNMHYIKCVLRDTEKDLTNFEACREIFYTYSANIIHAFISQEYEIELVEKLLKENYNYLEAADFEEIKMRCIAVVTGTGIFSAQGLMFNISRRNNILKRIEEFLQESNEIILDGFITFRLKEINEELSEMIERVVEDYVIEKEYSEFIKLLKYFVEIQESRYELVNIYIKSDSDFIIEDKNNKDITEEFFEDFNVDVVKGEINRHDILISALITSAPQKIVFHGIENAKDNDLIETIKSIFLDKLIFCQGCERCKNIGSEITNGK